MKIIYLHGLEAKPHPDKIAVLEKNGHEVLAPHFDFRSYNGIEEPFAMIREMAEKQGSEFIVGSSFGGFLGYWIGQALGIPQLLFNPALSYNSLLMPTPLVPVREELPSWVVLGAKDETVPPELNVDFFANKPASRVIVCQWLGHRTDLATFEQMTRWAGL